MLLTSEVWGHNRYSPYLFYSRTSGTMRYFCTVFPLAKSRPCLLRTLWSMLLRVKLSLSSILSWSRRSSSTNAGWRTRYSQRSWKESKPRTPFDTFTTRMATSLDRSQLRSSVEFVVVTKRATTSKSSTSQIARSKPLKSKNRSSYWRAWPKR